MAKFVCLLLFLAVLAHTGYSLKCYHCNSEKADGCLQKANPNTQPCGNTVGNQKAVCFYKEVIDANKKVVSVNSSCGILQQGESPDKLNNCLVAPPNSNKECRVCETDLCNSASMFSSSFYALLSLPVMYLITKFL